MAVFISYSRKDYYFAESLAFELLKRNAEAWLDVKDLKPGVDWERDLNQSLEAASCVVLVASPDAFRSSNVAAEWQLALKSGRRIIIALFRKVRLPPGLQSSEIVDCRGRFAPAVDQLAASIALPQPLQSRRSQIAGMPLVPPWVAVMALLITVPMFAFLFAAFWNSDEKADFSRVAFSALVLIYIALGSWFITAAWLRRKMGMTRLAICFATFAVFYGYSLELLLVRGPAGFAGFNSGFAQIILGHPLPWAVLGFLPLLGLMILAFVRPDDLLRWSPTGKAWSRYRQRRAAGLPPDLATVSSILTKIERFQLLYDAPDEPAAARFRDVLREMGAREAPDEAGATTVLLLTNRTGTLWLNRQSDRLAGVTLTVVASAIRLPKAVSWLWRREWIDFRRWKVHPPPGFERLPAVPESIDVPHFPAPVTRMHHVLCAFAALLGSACAVITGQDVPNLSPWQAYVGETSAIAAFWFMYAAWALVRRRITYKALTHWIVPSAFIAALPGLACLYLYMNVLEQNPFRALAAAPWLLIAPVLLYRLQPSVAFWLPAHVPRSAQILGESLDTGRHSRTLWILLLYTAVWLLLLDASLINDTP